MSWAGAVSHTGDQAGPASDAPQSGSPAPFSLLHPDSTVFTPPLRCTHAPAPTVQLPLPTAQNPRSYLSPPPLAKPLLDCAQRMYLPAAGTAPRQQGTAARRLREFSETPRGNDLSRTMSQALQVVLTRLQCQEAEVSSSPPGRKSADPSVFRAHLVLV